MYENLIAVFVFDLIVHSRYKFAKDIYPVLWLGRQWPQIQILGRMDRPEHKSACPGPKMYSRDKSSGRLATYWSGRFPHICRTSDSCSGQPRSLECCVSGCSKESISLRGRNTCIYQRHITENGIIGIAMTVLPNIFKETKDEQGEVLLDRDKIG